MSGQKPGDQCPAWQPCCNDKSLHLTETVTAQDILYCSLVNIYSKKCSSFLISMSFCFSFQELSEMNYTNVMSVHQLCIYSQVAISY